MNRVHSLRKSGNKVSVTHRRRYFDPVNKRWTLLSRYERSLAPLPNFVTPDVRGGETEVCIRTKDGRELRSVAKCSKKDVYVRSVGLNTALDGLVTEAVKPTTFNTDFNTDPCAYKQMGFNLNSVATVK